VWIGLISYGLYLYHWPVNFFLTPDVVGFGGLALDGFHLGLTFAIAAVSFHLIERPLRRASYGGWRRSAWPVATVTVLILVIVGTVPSLAQPWAGPVPTAPVVRGAGAGPGNVRTLGLPLATPQHLPSGELGVGLVGDDSMLRLAGPLIGALRSTGVRASMINGPGWGLLDVDGQTLSSSAVATTINLTALGVHEARQGLVLVSWSSSDRSTLLGDPARERAAVDVLVGELIGNPAETDVVLLAQPMPTGEGSSALKIEVAASRWNDIARSEVARHPGHVAFLEIAGAVGAQRAPAPIFLPPSNRPLAPRDHWVRNRMTDGVGVCQPGVVREAWATVVALRSLLGDRAPTGNWWTGAWTDYLRFDEPGRCLNDHSPSGR
jgi:hypothetical protein